MMIKKTYLIFLFSVLLLSSCDDRNDLTSYLEEHARRIAVCDTLVDKLNQDIETTSALLKSMNKGLYVTSITTATDGKIIYFSDGSSYKVFDGKNGSDGPKGDTGVTEYPKVSVKQIDTTSYWYWTVNGQLLKDGNGNYVRAGALDNYVPILKIVDGWWVTSCDGGLTWQKISEADENQIYQGGDFSSAKVTEEGDIVTIDLGDGQTVFSFRLYGPEQELSARINKGAQAVQLLDKAYREYDAVVSVSPCYDVNGNILSYSLEMYSSGTISFSCGSNSDSSAPRVSSVVASGSYCWHINDTTFSDRTVADNSVAVKVEDGNWKYSFNGSATWETISQIGRNEGVAGGYSITSVITDAGNVTITFASGSTMSFPLVQKITSFVYIPDYSDGSAAVGSEGKASLHFEFFPSSASSQLLQKGTFSVKAFDASDHKAEMNASISGSSASGNILTLSVEFSTSSQWEDLVPYAEVSAVLFGQELSGGYFPLYKKVE